MRLCHVSPHLPPDQAANALLPAQLGRWAVERGDQVALVAHAAAQTGPFGSGTSNFELQTSNFSVRWIPRRAPAGSMSRFSRFDAWRVARQVSAALDDVAADANLLHLHSNGLIIEVAAAWAHRRRIPYVLTVYGTEIWHYQKRRPIDLFARAYRRAAHVTFYSQKLLERARDLGLDRPGLSVTYPAVAAEFAPRDEATRHAWRSAMGVREPVVVLNVKRLHALAGHRFLIDAFARIARGRSDVRLVICGTGALRASLEHQARTVGVGDRVTFTGLLPNDEIARWMAVADVFVLPSLLEALPTVAVEALASGTPVISADHPGGIELAAIFGGDVSVVPRERVEPLSVAIGEFLAHPRRTTSDTAQQVARRFRPAAVFASFDAVYEEALRART